MTKSSYHALNAERLLGLEEYGWLSVPSSPHF